MGELWLKSKTNHPRREGEKLKIICDTREQKPYTFPDLDCTTERGTLPVGDYSLPGFEEQVAIERKSLDDLIGCLTRDRGRFERELQRARHYELFAVVVEGSLGDVEEHKYRSQMHPVSAIQSIIAFTVRYGTNFIFAGDRRSGEYITHSLLSKYLEEIEKRYRQAKKSA